MLERSGGVTRNTAAGDHRGAERISLHVFLGGSWGNPMHAHNTRLDSESHPNVSPKPTRTANRPDPHEDSVLSSVRPLRCPHGCAIYTTHTTIPLSCCCTTHSKIPRRVRCGRGLLWARVRPSPLLSLCPSAPPCPKPNTSQRMCMCTPAMNSTGTIRN